MEAIGNPSSNKKDDKNYDVIEDSKKINSPFQMAELDRVLHNINIHSSPGDDGIPYILLVKTPLVAKQFMLDFFNKSWSCGHIPQKLKHSVVKPVLKPKKKQI